MQDALNTRHGRCPTGNGRNRSRIFRCRATNTIMLNGDRDPAEIIASVKDSLRGEFWGTGGYHQRQVRLLGCGSMNRERKAGARGQRATLIDGPDALTRVSMIGNDMALDSGVGNCGKDGQTVPVGVGQPTLRIDGLTVGGTA
jgi:TldD protein